MKTSDNNENTKKYKQENLLFILFIIFYKKNQTKNSQSNLIFKKVVYKYTGSSII